MKSPRLQVWVVRLIDGFGIWGLGQTVWFGEDSGLQKRYSEEVETQCWLWASYVSLPRPRGWGCALGPALCWAELPLGRRAWPRRLQAGLWRSGEGSGSGEARRKRREQEYGIGMKTESQAQEEACPGQVGSGVLPARSPPTGTKNDRRRLGA